MNKEAITATAKAKLIEAGMSESDLYTDDSVEPLAITDGDGGPVTGWWVKVEVFVGREEV